MKKIEFIKLQNTIKDESGNVINSGLPDKENPIYNFNQEFINKLQSISSVEMGQIIPYISIDMMDAGGNVLHNFNMEFFHKQVDFKKIKDDERYSDRPEMSLLDLEIQTTQASGYLFYSDINFNIKIHKPSAYNSSALVSFLFPGAMMRLTYGGAGGDSVLCQKETVFFNVVNYTINVDMDGQVDLKVKRNDV